MILKIGRAPKHHQWGGESPAPKRPKEKIQESIFVCGALLRDYGVRRRSRIFQGNRIVTAPQYASQKGRKARSVVTLTCGVLPLRGSQTEGTGVPGLWASTKFGEPANETQVLKQKKIKATGVGASLFVCRHPHVALTKNIRIQQLYQNALNWLKMASTPVKITVLEQELV